MARPDRTPRDWHELTEVTQGAALIVERVRISASGIVIEGDFALPQLAQLDQGDQVFAAAFLRSHGSIKEMEQMFGVSYPTIKARLNRVARILEVVETDPAPSRGEVLDKLARGEISAPDAIRAVQAAR